MPDPNNPEILAGTLNRREQPVDELAERRARQEALGTTKTASAEDLSAATGLLAAGPSEAAPEPPAASEEGETPRPAMADQLVMFVSADGLRRVEMVSAPWAPPPNFIELAMPGRRKVISLPGQDDAVETRRYRYRQSNAIRELGLVIHVFIEE
jgi:hypothetical protein